MVDAVSPEMLTRPAGSQEAFASNERGLGGIVRLTVVVRLLEVHVDDTARENRAHLIPVQGSGLLEGAVGGATDLVAAVLGEEDGNRVVLEEFDLLVIARRLDGLVAAPLVDVVAPEVDGVVLIAAVEVVSNVGADLRVIVGGVADAHPAIDILLDVGLDVAHGCLDVGRGWCGLVVVGDLVAGKEADHVAVLAEVVDHGGVALQQVDIPGGVVADDGQRGLAQVADDVNAGVVKELHALVVVGVGVDGISADHVGVEGLE
jgi:hypothetical protein